MTRVEALRSALSKAVADGDQDVARELTKIVAEEIERISILRLKADLRRSNSMSGLKKLRSPRKRDVIRLIDRGES